MDIHHALDQSALIRPEERDYHLKLRLSRWGNDLDRQKWTADKQPALHFTRTIPVHIDGKGTSELHESIVRFPSAAIYGINRKAEYGKNLERRPNMHTVRVLRRPNTTGIHRLFILHNGLNEASDLRFYYRLSDWILRAGDLDSSGEGTACVIVPFPGHLTHFAFHGPFSETPLGRYLNDAGELFRQFLRYMVGMKWFLSAVAEPDAKEWMVGGDLLETDRPVHRAMSEESTALYRASRKRVRRTDKLRAEWTDDPGAPGLDIGANTREEQIEQDIDVLRSVLLRDSPHSRAKKLRTHVVGYSLGGFVAQAVFFAWPQVVSSCTTICSGGALSSLSPTAFANPEEWQSVLHALRPELSSSMLQGRLGAGAEGDGAAVNEAAGMPLQRFGYFQRIFEQVFLQEDRGSYKERLSEYGLRMMFLSGGEDPIAPPTNILDASPAEGTTMLSISSMTHFLNQDPNQERAQEKKQRDFWLPEAGGLIAHAAIHSEQVHMAERAAAQELAADRRPRRPKNRPLLTRDLSSSDEFEVALDSVLEVVKKTKGWLIICRNTLPAAFIRSDHFTQWGSALHHHDVKIQAYAAGLRRRALMLNDLQDRTTLLIPEQLKHWFTDLTEQFDAHSDAPSGRRTTRDERRQIWSQFEQDWWRCARRFKAGELRGPYGGRKPHGKVLAPEVAKWQSVNERFVQATQLPDVWIGIHPNSAFHATLGNRDSFHQAFVDQIATILSEPSLLDKDLQKKRIRIVQVSGAEFNPRHRGRIESKTEPVMRLLARCAMGLVNSKPMKKPSATPSK